MHELLQHILKSDEKTALRPLVSSLRALNKKFLLRNEILYTFANYCYQYQKPFHFFHSSTLGKLINYTHEIILEDESIWFLLRPRIASQEVWRLGTNMSSFELMTPQDLLDVRDRLVQRYQCNILEIDLEHFYYGSPRISDPRNIGQGLTFLNHHLCSQFATAPEYWLEILFYVLRERQYDGRPLLINDRIQSGLQLSQQVTKAIKLVSDRPAQEPYEQFRFELQELGLEPGWGHTAERVCETLELLTRLIDNPSPTLLEAFVARVPAVFRVVLVSIHGWVSQEGIRGRPETADQVMYVLEQAHTLENKLREEIHLAGLDLLNIQPQVIILTRLIPNCEGVLCSLRLEKILGTENGWILRVPFGEFNPEVTRNWISKFEIWPYLETFALDAEPQVLAQLRGNPDLIIGNYTDGNLVAFLLARRLKATQCNIAHSLEKPKYLFSNLYWQDLEETYHFSAQFTADLISMNAASFIVTSTTQEIVGTPDTIGQYESYQCFTMPQLYHVVHGIDLFSPRFNTIPPGVDENIFFPYNQTQDRDPNLRSQIDNLLFTQENPLSTGFLNNQNKLPILAVAALNAIDNITGLAECFGKSQQLRECCNLILVTNKMLLEHAKNPEEAEEIKKLHSIIEQYHLHGHIRWLGMPLSSVDVGEVYRVVADYKGIFIHFASFEAFGRTIVEAMSSGLPTFATQFGGALEIIGEEEDEFLLNPTDLAGTAKKILDFINQCNDQPEHWDKVSNWASQRVRNKYNWESHTKQLLSLAKIYSFWHFINPDNHEARIHYLEALFHLLYKPRAEKILEQHMLR